MMLTLLVAGLAIGCSSTSSQSSKPSKYFLLSPTKSLSTAMASSATRGAVVTDRSTSASSSCSMQKISFPKIKGGYDYYDKDESNFNECQVIEKARIYHENPEHEPKGHLHSLSCSIADIKPVNRGKFVAAATFMPPPISSGGYGV